MKNWMSRTLALILVVCTIFGLCVPAQATSIGDGSQTCNVALGMRNNYLVTTAGTTLGAGNYTYTTNDGLSGTAYCIDHGLDYTDAVLPITGKYIASPATAGAFANGYPQHSVQTFLELYQKDNAVLEGLTEEEYAYATQVAVWATLGQLGVDGTPYTAGREYLNPPTGDTQQARVFRTVQLILEAASKWDRIYQTGMYIRLDKNTLGGNISIDSTTTLEFAANNNQYGIKREVINGKSYYTREYTFASATSTYYSDYNIALWADNAPEGTIFTDLENKELPHDSFREHSTWQLPTTAHYELSPTINNNGYEYWGKAKLCIPVDTATPSGEIILNCGAYVMQYEIYLANNEDYTEQSYIIADPSKGTQTADASLSWGGPLTEQGYLKVTKVGGGGEPLAGAEFTLTGSDGSSRTATTNDQGVIFWSDLRPDAVYTLTESKAPAGYAVVEPRTIHITAAHTTFETVKDDPSHTLTVHKQDVQTGYSLLGATFCFEQIDGAYKTTKVTDHAGNIQLNAEQLPLGTYKVYEVAAPKGYELDKTVQTVNWDGKRDVTLTFKDTRKLTFIISKKDSRTGYNLPGASFEVIRNGQLVTTVTTNDAGLAYVTDVAPGYYEVKESVAPAGYTLNPKTYGINIDPYDPATSDDPRLVITNDPMPSLRIVKYDRQTNEPLAGVSFKVYKDTTLLGTYTTDKAGEILLTGLEPGTYTVQEVSAPGTHIADSTPQSVELKADRTEPVTLVFLNSLKPGIHLIKLDNETIKPLPNATFRISMVGDSYQQELTTDAKGEIDLSKLDPGTYQVQEVKAPSGYVVDDAIRTVQLKAGQNAEFVFSNSKKPGLKIVKTDSVSGKPVEGVTFTVKEADGHTITTEATDAKGEVLLEDMAPGVVEIWERSVPNNYLLNEEHQLVTLTPGRLTTVHFENAPKLSLRIVKYDQQTGKPLANTTFRVYRDAVLLGEYTTDEAGEILLTGLMPGTYLAQEIAAPDTHTINSTPQQVELVEGQSETVTLVFFDTVKPGIHLVKVDSQTMDPLAGATFRVTRVGGSFDQEYITDTSGEIDLSALEPGTYQIQEVKAPDGYAMDDAIRTVEVKADENALFVFTDTPLSKLTLTKRDASGEAMAGVSFSLTPMGDGAHSDERTTDAQGVITWEGLTPGLYSLMEVSTKSTHVLDATEHHIRIYPGKDASVTLVNEEKPSLKITKYDRASHTPMEGVTFEVYRDTVSLGKFKTDSKGEILLDHIDPGTYKAVEIDTGDDGHILTTTPQEIELHAGDGVRELVYFDDRLPGIHLVKVDGKTLEPLAGAIFRVNAVGGSFDQEYTTGEDGEIDLSKLEPGTYQVQEVKAPDGYLVDSGVRTVEVKAGQNALFVFTDSIKPSLHLLKRDEDGKPLEGAAFRIAAVEDGSHVYDRTTDKNGEITITDLEPGVYSVTETIAPKNYALDGKEHHVELFPGKASEIILTNTLKPSLRIVKYDRQSHTPMEGVTFEVFRDGLSIGKYETNAEGVVLLDHIDPGTYKAVEIDTGDDGHILTTTPQEIELHAGDGVRELAFFNDRLPGLHLIKVDSADLSIPIANAKFCFTAVGGDYGPVELTTGEDGTIDLSKLPTGAYVVTELECPGYVVDDAQRMIHLDGNETAQFVFTNTKLPSFKLTKTGADGTPLEGVTFRIAYIQDGTHYMDRTTNAQGEIVIDGLAPGVLSIVETATLPNYILDPTEHHVELTAGKHATVTLKNNRRPNLTIHKVDADTDEPVAGAVFVVEQPDGHSVAEVTTGQDGSVTVPNLLPGAYVVTEKSVPVPYLRDAEDQTVTLYANHDREVAFRNHKMPSLTVNKVDAITGDPIQGAKFHVTYASNKTDTGEINDLGDFYSDDHGQFIITDLKDGWYRVEELEPAKGYTIKEPAVQEVYISGGESKTLTFKNVPLSALVVWKYDSVTGAAVEGAVFSVKYLGGISGSGGTVIGTYKTSANGSFTVTGLQAGTYIVEELASDSGHVIDTAPQTAYISGKEQDVVELYFGNSPKGSLLVKKVDSATGKPLSDVEFLVTTADGAVVGDANGKFVTDSAGSFTISGIDPGTTLVVKETRAKDGYILDDAPQTIQVKAGQTATLEFRNAPMGALVITKRDANTNKPLRGAEFRVTTSDGTFVAAQGGAVSSNGLYTTDANGQIILTGLEPDTYVVTETKAPSGYVLDATPQTVRVNTNDTQTLYFYNTPIPAGGLRIVKLDEETRQPISGVEFLVTRINGERLGTYRTNSRGVITLDELTPGWYTVVETKAADGYALDAQPHDIQVRDGQTATLEVTNRLTGSALIHKVDSVTGQGIYGVTFLVSDAKGNPVGQYTSDDQGYVYIDGELADGKYTIREIQQAEGYILDTVPKTVYIEYGGCSTVTWKNTPITGQIQIVKTSADYNPTNGWPAGTPIPGCEFEIYDKAGNLVDTIRTDKNGVAASKALPLGQYKVVESKTADFYILDSAPLYAEIQFAGQIVRIAAVNRSVTTGAAITKTGYKEVMPGQTERFTFSDIGSDTSTVSLQNFYWRDTLPAAVTLDKVVTGTYNCPGTYKVVYKVNNTGDYRTLADNLSTAQSYTLDARPVALGLAANERITEVMFVFGVVPAGFHQVEAPALDVTVAGGLPNGYQFSNQADAGGSYNGAWIQAVSRWVTTVYAPTKPLPRTGY